jgi:hypothetical protein
MIGGCFGQIVSLMQRKTNDKPKASQKNTKGLTEKNRRIEIQEQKVCGDLDLVKKLRIRAI